MKKILFLLLCFLPLLTQAQFTVNPFTGQLDNNGNLSKAYVENGIAYFIVKGDTVASDTLNGTTALFTELERQLDSIVSLRNASNQNYSFILAQQDSLFNHRTVLNQVGVIGNATAPPYFDGSANGGQILYFYGNNGFWTALQGGAPTANRSYRLPIAALPSAGDSAYIVIDEYGNMKFVPYVAPGSGGTGLSDVDIADINATGTPSAFNYLRGDGTWNTPDGTGGGTYTAGTYIDITNNVVSLDTANFFGDGEIALSFGDTVDLLATKHDIATFSGGYDTSYLYSVISDQQSQIDNLINLLQSLGDYDLIAPRFQSAFIRRDTLYLTMDSTDIQQDSIPNPGDFYLTEGSNQLGIASLTLANDLITMKLDSVGLFGQTYLLDYTRGWPTLQDSTGNRTANWVNKSITNLVAEIIPEAPNLITNGVFANATGWTMYTDVSVAAGVLVIPRAGTWFYQDGTDMTGGVGLQVSTTYELEFDLVVDEADVVDFMIMAFGTSDQLVARATYSTGHITLQFTTPSVWTFPGNDHGLRFQIYYTMSSTIDNMTLTEI